MEKKMKLLEWEKWYWRLWFVIGILIVLTLLPECAHSFSGFEGKMRGLNQSLTSMVLPLVSILGLVYAAILAAMGDGAAKGRMTMVIVASILGFLAGPIIRWIQAVMGY